jgi:hypothetical protein
MGNARDVALILALSQAGRGNRPQSRSIAKAEFLQ